MEWTHSLKRLFTVLAFFCLHGPGLAHEPDWVVRFREVGLEDGLSSRFIYDLYQDTEGYMWFATSEGLNRYDGYGVEVFNLRQMGSDLAVPRDLLEDCDQYLWLVSWEDPPSGAEGLRMRWQVEVLDPYRRKLREEPLHFPFHMDDLTAMGHIPGQLILLGTQQGQVYGYDGQFFLLYQDPERRSVGQVLGAGQDGVVVQAGNSLIRLNAKGELETRLELPEVPVFRLWLDAAYNPWVLSRQAGGDRAYLVYQGNWSASTLERRSLPVELNRKNPSDFELAFSPDGCWTLGYDGFLGVFEASGRMKLDLSGELRDRQMHLLGMRFFFDRLGGLWLTHQKGLARISWNRNYFQHYLHHPPLSIRGMTWLDDSLLFVANYGYPLLLNTRSGEQRQVYPGQVFGLGVCRDTQGYWWMGVHDKGFVRFNPDFSGMQAITMIPASSRMSRQAADGQAPYLDRSGKLWLGFGKGLGYWDPGTCQIQVVDKAPGFSGLDEEAVNAFLETDEGIWIGTSRGLYRMQDGVVNGFVASLAPYFIYHLYQDAKGLIWVATRGDGLLRWDPVSDQVWKYSTRTGWISDVIYSVVADERGLLWLPTNKGLVRFDPEKEAVSFFREPDGLAGEEFNFLAFERGVDGRLYLGGLEGITAFHPDSIRDAQSPVIPIHLSAFLEWDPEVGMMIDRTPRLREEGRIVLKPPIQSFQLSFTPLGYQSPQNYQYAYWVEGLEPSWTFLDQPTLQLARIPPGEYILHVNGRGENGQWSASELRIPLKVLKPFFKRWYFWVVLVLLSVGIAVLYYHWNVWRLKSRQSWLETEVDRRTQDLLESQRLVREQNQELEKLNQTKDQLFLILAHELKNPVLSFRNVSQKINYLIRQNQTERLEQFSATLDRSATDARNLLDNLLQWAKTQRGTFILHPRIIFLKEAFDLVRASYEDRAAEKGISLAISLEEESVSAWADPTAMQVLLRNLVDNAVKFTPEGGQISLGAEKDGEDTRVWVRDTGLGIKPEVQQTLFQAGGKPAVGTAGEKGTGLGLLLVRELMDLHGGAIRIQSEFNKGTTFELWFPSRENLESASPQNKKQPQSEIINP